jgi:AcrR family transcriptional regulator
VKAAPATTKTAMPEKLAASPLLLVSQHGIDNVSPDDMAAHAKVTKGSLCGHYHS